MRQAELRGKGYVYLHGYYYARLNKKSGKYRLYQGRWCRNGVTGLEVERDNETNEPLEYNTLGESNPALKIHEVLEQNNG